MKDRAKSISCEDLTKTGAKVAEFLKAERIEQFADVRIAYFPDHGIFGGEVVLAAATGMQVGKIAELAGTISDKVLSPMFEVQPAVAIKDRFLIFGGDLAPNLRLGFGQ